MVPPGHAGNGESISRTTIEEYSGKLHSDTRDLGFSSGYPVVTLHLALTMYCFDLCRLFCISEIFESLILS